MDRSGFLQRASHGVVAALATAGVFAPAASAAAPGDLDPGFASAGIYTGGFQTVFPPDSDDETVAVDGQGRVLSAATRVTNPGDSTGRSIVVVRLTAAGAVDKSFGSNGTEALAFPGASDVYVAGLRIDSLGRLVVVGADFTTSSSPRIALARLTSAGLPDPSFSGDGYLLSGLPGGPNPIPSDVAIDKGGGLLVAGTGTTGCPASCSSTGFVARFTSAGALDTTYGSHAGWLQIGAANVHVRAIVGLPGGGGFVTGFDYDRILVARLTAGGALDTTFDPGGATPGIATTDAGKAAADLVSDYGLAVDAGGRPIAVGQQTIGGNARAILARFTTAGAPDATFGDGSPAKGTVRLPTTINGRLTDAVVQGDGKILAVGVGTAPGANSNEIMLARLAADGALDTGFAPASPVPGIAFTSFADVTGGYDISLSAGGALVGAFHRTNNPFGYLPNVVRYLTGTEASAPPPPPPSSPPPPSPSDATTTTPPAQGVAAPFVTAPSATAPPAQPAVSAAAQLVLSCSHTRLTLTNVIQRGRRVALTGVADAGLIGKPVDIVYAGRALVAHAVVGPDGSFATTAPLPPAKTRTTNAARYTAQAGGQHSLDLKLTRRVILQPLTSGNGRVTIAGQVVRPLARPIASIAVQQQVSCTRVVTVAHLRPTAGGRIHLTLKAPAGQAAAVYRLATRVRRSTRRLKTFPTFSLPQAVEIR